MKCHDNIDKFLRENRPQVKDDPTFLLEVQQKMLAVDGIKAEVDRQRRYGRFALIGALVSGLLVGVLGMCLVYLYPIDSETILHSDFLSSIRTFFETYQKYLLLPIAACAIGLGLSFARRQ